MGWVLLVGAVCAVADEKVLVVVGDSLSAGYGIDLEAGWVSLLQQRLTERNAAIRVVNASISGDTTAGGLARMDTTLERHRPSVVVVELGGNDGLRGVTLSASETNLDGIVTRSLAAGAKVLVVGVRLPPNYGPVYTQRFADMYQAVADRHGVALVPRILEGVGERPELVQDDGIHPTAQAQPILLENVWAGLGPLLGLE